MHPSLVREIINPTDSVAIVNVTVGPPDHLSRPNLHWRAGQWQKPPVDIEINPVDGRLQAIQLVLQDELFPTWSLSLPEQAQAGLPCVDRQPWGPDPHSWDEINQSYIDETLEIPIGWGSGDTLWVSFGPIPARAVAQVVDEPLILLVASDRRWVGIGLTALTPDEHARIERARIG
jgi:hypothetical protein